MVGAVGVEPTSFAQRDRIYSPVQHRHRCRAPKKLVLSVRFERTLHRPSSERLCQLGYESLVRRVGSNPPCSRPERDASCRWATGANLVGLAGFEPAYRLVLSEPPLPFGHSPNRARPIAQPRGLSRNSRYRRENIVMPASCILRRGCLQKRHHASNANTIPII